MSNEDAVTNAALMAVMHNIDGDRDAYTRCIDAILGDTTGEALYIACVAWASMFDQALNCDDADCECTTMPVAFYASDVGMGQPIDVNTVDPGDVPDDMRARLWASQFIAAVSTQDLAAARGLHRTLLVGPKNAGPVELLGMTVQALTARNERNKRGHIT